MNQIIKEKEVLKCIVCRKELPTTEHTKCPHCKNVLGISVNEVKVKSIGDLLFKKQLADDVLAFAFDFEFELDCYKNISLNELQDLSKPFLGVQVFLNVSGQFGLGGVHVVAVFHGTDELDVVLSEEHLQDLTQKMMPAVAATLQGEDESMDFEDIDDEFDTDINTEDTQNLNGGILSPEFIADAMFSIVSDELPISEEDWRSMPMYAKVEMVKVLQQVPEKIVDLVNFVKYNYIPNEFDVLKEAVKAIINEHIYRYNLACNIVREMTENSTDEDNTDIKELSLLDNLKEILEVESIGFKTSESFDISDFDKEYEMISIINPENKECLHVISLNDEYRVFDTVKDFKGYKIFDLNDKTSTSLSYLALLALISKMGLKREDELKNISQDDIDEILELGNLEDLDFNTSGYNYDKSDSIIATGKTTINSKRELLLKQIEELSDEDLINELKRRMSLK